MGRKREKISVTLYAKRDLLTTGWEEVVTQKVLICCIIEEEDDMGNTEKEQDKYLCHNPFKWPHSVLLFHHISSIPDRPHSSSYLTPPKSTLTQACSTPFPCSWHLIPCCFIYRRKKKKHYLTSLVWQKKFLILMLYSGSPNSWSILRLLKICCRDLQGGTSLHKLEEQVLSRASGTCYSKLPRCILKKSLAEKFYIHLFLTPSMYAYKVALQDHILVINKPVWQWGFSGFE